MKFDTKKSTPSDISPEHAFLQDNPYVPSDKQNDNSPSTTDTLGRQVLYEPSLFYTPIYASQRIFEQPKSKKRLLTKDSMDELNQQLEALFIGDDKPSVSFDSDDDKPSVSFDSETSTPPKVKQEEEVDDDEPLGRCRSTYYGRKGRVTVTRSCRLAEK